MITALRHHNTAPHNNASSSVVLLEDLKTQMK